VAFDICEIETICPMNSQKDHASVHYLIQCHSKKMSKQSSHLSPDIRKLLCKDRKRPSPAHNLLILGASTIFDGCCSGNVARAHINNTKTYSIQVPRFRHSASAFGKTRDSHFEISLLPPRSMSAPHFDDVHLVSLTRADLSDLGNFLVINQANALPITCGSPSARSTCSSKNRKHLQQLGPVLLDRLSSSSSGSTSRRSGSKEKKMIRLTRFLAKFKPGKISRWRF
jgi:hypothetical protein